MKDLLLSVCIPVRDDLSNLKQCLDGFRNQDLSECEILVCDDGSTPPLTTSGAQAVGVEFTLISQAAQGPSAARNHMARVAAGKYLFFLDADTVPHFDMVERARNIIAEHPELDVFYGSYDDEPADRSLISFYKNLLHHHTHHQSANHKQKITTFWCGCGVIRRELYLESGGLSEFYVKPSIEDIEFGARLSAQGIRIDIFPQLQVKHLKKWTLRSWLYTDLFRRGIPWVRLMRARNEWASQLNFSWSQRIASLAVMALVLCIPLAAMRPGFALAGLLAFMVFLIPNFSFIDLVRRKRGLVGAFAIIPLHVVYALVCVASVGCAFFCPPLKLSPTSRLQSPREGPIARVTDRTSRT
jgi:glycosyltransferase involved in cell wall biosynthesis